jgi:Ca2+-transporting ATPase
LVKLNVKDSLGALGLASEEPDDAILKQPPHRKTETMFTREMVQYMLLIIAYEVSLSMFTLVFGYRVVGIPKSDTELVHTLVFTSFVLMQVANEITTRQLKHELNILKNFFGNKLFIILLLLIVAIQAIAVQFGKSFVQTKPLNTDQWIYSFIVGFALIPYVFVGRICMRAYNRWESNRKVYAQPTSSKEPRTTRSTVLKSAQNSGW